MSSPLKTVWANAWVRRPLLVGLALAVVLGGCWVVIDQLGKRAWLTLQKQLAAEGETTDFRALLSPPIPETENFCAIPPLRNLGAAAKDHSAVGEEGRANRERIEAALKVRPWNPPMVGLELGVPLPFAKIAAEMRQDGSWPMPPEPGWPERDVNAGLAKWDPLIDELAAGLERPGGQWTPCWSERAWPRPYLNIEMPHLLTLVRVGPNLSLRAAAAGSAGDLRRAIVSLRIVNRLALATADEPLLLNLVVATALEGVAVHAIWEFCWMQQGTAEQWLQLEQITRAYDVRGGFLRCHRGELAAHLDTILLARDTRQSAQLVVLLPGTHGFPPAPHGALDSAGLLGLSCAPRGLFDAVAVESATGQMQYFIRPLRDASWTAHVQSAHALRTRLDARAPVWSLPEMMTRHTLQVFAPMMIQSLHLQTRLDQAAIACVLERVRLVAGVYPASLAGLTLADGQPLPLDACTGAPMHYRLSSDGRYVLWSEGPDGKDDGGSRGSTRAVPSAPNYTGDWVWGYTP
jgi:hypothetical protein